MGRVRHIFRWDLDKTYLKTEFDTFSDLLRTARLSAEERENIPGSAALMRAIHEERSEDADLKVYFISGSPEQMRSVLEKKFALDGFAPDGFVLKPTVSNILRGRFRAVRGQVGYKLAQLLSGRGDAPVGTTETLFGDDAESDAFIYSFYADVIAGRVPDAEVDAVLAKAGAYPAQVEEIHRALEAIVHEDPVRRIVIHLDQHTPPAAFAPFFPRVVPINNHLQTAIILYLDGTLGPGSIQHVARELLDRYGFDVERLTHLAEDILRRRRAYHDAEALHRLAADLRALPRAEGEPGDTKPGEALDEETAAVVAAVAERTDHLASRPPPADRIAKAPQRDYLELLTLEQQRQEEAKRAKKLALKVSRDEERRAAKARGAKS